MTKYQLSITIRKAADKNSAASKAVTDCSHILGEQGYEEYNLVFPDGINTLKYYFVLFIKLTLFFIKLRKNSVVAVQYPMLNNVFKYFIKISVLKKTTFFCIVHDIESLRLGGTDKIKVRQETGNLNHYDFIIVHNPVMERWLKDNGVIKPMVTLKLFDYLSATKTMSERCYNNTIVFAGNLAKSKFIYQLGNVAGWDFNIYGPNYITAISADNVQWCGEYSPEEIVNQLDGNFGLIWDGDDIMVKDPSWGNYLKYNNPHKFSLYVAAGLPVIAPRDSAIAKLILEENIGVLIDNVYDVSHLNITLADYNTMKSNCLTLRTKVVNGYFFREALTTVEQMLLNLYPLPIQ